MKTSLNYTSFIHASVKAKILEAMRKCLATGEVTRLVNRKGDAWLLVTIARDDLGYKFAFIDTAGFDQWKAVQRAAIAEWEGDEYWSLMSASFDLTEHPAVSYRKAQGVALFEQINETFKSNMRSLGATHKVITYGGSVLGYGAYQRNWYGKKCLYLVADKHGISFETARKVSKESLLMVARVEEI